MTTISLTEYRPVLCDNAKAQEILDKIRFELKKDDVVKLDFDGVVSMATCCSRLIFGNLYKQLGPEKFFAKIAFSNTSVNLQKSIRAGIKG